MAWDADPLASDEATTLAQIIRDVLDRALDPLRDDHHDTGGPAVIDVANQAGAIIGALGQQGIDVRPPNALLLAAARADRLSSISKAALVSEPARRSGFPSERAAERWLRESGVAYEHWHRAAAHGDDLGAAWRGLDSAYELLRIARATGGSDERLAAALRASLEETAARATDAQRTAILRLTGELAQSGLERAMTSLAVIGHTFPDLAAHLRALLDPIVESRLSIN